MSNTRAMLGAAACLALAAPGSAQDRMVGVNWLGTLYEIDLATGGTTSLGSLGVGRLNSLAMRPDGTLWSARAGDTDTGEPSRLYMIDPINVTATLVAEMAPSVDVRGLTWTDDGDLTAILDLPASNMAQLARIDPVTGAVTPLTTFDSAFRVQSLETAPSGELVAWDLDSGMFAVGDDGAGYAQLSPFFAGSQSIQSLAYGPGGMLYGSSASLVTPQAFGQGGLYLIDPVTWLPTFIGEHDAPFEMRGMAYIPSPGAGGFMLGILAVAVRRRR